MSDTHGTVFWTELMTRDIPGAKAYYGAICGWSFSDMPMPDGTYVLGMLHDKPVVGMMDMADAPQFKDLPPHWFSYFAVDDVDAEVARTRDMGGTVIRDPFDVPGTGRIAILKDPTGAAMGLMTPEPMG